jgi:hypothetical protein
MKRTAYAIVKKKNPRISIYDIYPSKKDVHLGRDEKWIKIEIKAI